LSADTQPDTPAEPTLADRLAEQTRLHRMERDRHEEARRALLERVVEMLVAGELTPREADRIVSPHDFEPGRDANQ
jgi:hypothetical protein